MSNFEDTAFFLSKAVYFCYYFTHFSPVRFRLDNEIQGFNCTVTFDYAFNQIIKMLK